jgi:prepilin-type N-terminal cleavage/methylation domain-containing protein
MKNRKRSRRSGLKRGFSLTEVIMAMTLLSVVLLSLAKMSFVLSQRSRANDTLAKRNAVLMQEANKFSAMPYASLAGFSNGSTTVTQGDFTFTRTLTITANTDRKDVKIVITPSKEPTKKDSVTIYRTLPPGSPLCTGC